MTSLDDEWIQYLTDHGEDTSNYKHISNNIKDEIITIEPPQRIPENVPTKVVRKDTIELFISTKTKVLFLNCPIDINSIFWKIPIVSYCTFENGIIKKQMKVISKTIEEYEIYKQHLQSIPNYKEAIIKQIDNPLARSIKFKDERKITIGLSKKDLLTNVHKKNAFYNCFALFIRLYHQISYKEIHVKVFNTGKMEVPGIVNNEIFDKVKVMILELLQPYMEIPLYFIDNFKEEHVLINSNFNCGFYIKRDMIQKILNVKYGIDSSYDPCSYPGVKCKYYFINEVGFDIEKQKGRILEEDNHLKLSEIHIGKKYTEVSFMIFRTGSCLIVGNCCERILRFIFDYLINILLTERDEIYVSNDNPTVIASVKKEKKRKTIAMFSKDVYETIMNENCY